jgi:hypothetical protein
MGVTPSSWAGTTISSTPKDGSSISPKMTHLHGTYSTVKMEEACPKVVGRSVYPKEAESRFV